MIQESHASIFITRENGGYSIGLAMFESHGLRGWLCEIESDPAHPYNAIDRVLHLLFVIDARSLEIGAASQVYFDEIAESFAHLECRYHDRYYGIEEQNALLREAFALTTLLSPIEHLSLEGKPLSAQALTVMADKLRQCGAQHYPLPRWLESGVWMELGNNALEQIEMISVDPKRGNIAGMFLNMFTPMGERLGRFRLFLPIKNKRELLRRYEWIESVNGHSRWFAERLRAIGDLEWLWWELVSRQTQNVEAFSDSVGLVMELQRYCVQHKLTPLLSSETLIGGWEIEFRNHHRQNQWLEAQIPLLQATIDWVAQIDVAVTSALNAQKYRLVRPNIVDTKGENFLQIGQLRHLLVEEQRVRYVPNDIVMGEREYLDLPCPETVMVDPRVHDGASIRGVLLYGINSSGKSSLMKSIGIAVTLAQAGFFVPAQAMNFSLLDGIYTRIQSRDNVAKSLSTFGVEMLELNTIFSRASSRSLVLGDEISHGTETLSAVSIVASTILQLHQRGCLFVMTTHLHQLSMIRELSRLREVVSLHLSVRYDEKEDRLIYDRILKSGRGSSVYGLEFAESLHMNSEFLDNAARIRENLAKEYDVLELGNHKEYIKRYREVVACECVICGALIRPSQKNIHAKEHHHLIPLCETHTRAISQGKIKLQGFIMTSQGLRLEYETQLKED
jgi:DNA mismatch repair ATPase MutS